MTMLISICVISFVVLFFSIKIKVPSSLAMVLMVFLMNKKATFSFDNDNDNKYNADDNENDNNNNNNNIDQGNQKVFSSVKMISNVFNNGRTIFICLPKLVLEKIKVKTYH